MEDTEDGQHGTEFINNKLMYQSVTPTLIEEKKMHCNFLQKVQAACCIGY
jgi:hypothetical protein